MRFSSLIALSTLSAPLLTYATYTWPSHTIDELEHLLVDTGGPDDGLVKAAITPCTTYTMGTQILGRMTAAQWLRVAFHDSAPGVVSTGVGGMDASIGFETLRAENSGAAMNDTMGFFANYTSAYVSMADLLALGVVQSVYSCGGPNIPLRVGRIDATGPGPTGTPEPETSITDTLAQAKINGYTQAQFIQLTACGHTMGATHHAGFPQVVTADAVTANNTGGGINFDSTKGVFDINVVNEYLTGTGQRGGPLVTTANVTVQSDLRLFTSDKNVTMKALSSAGASAFATTCSNLFAQMINTVPKGVTLTDAITPMAVKPVNVSLSVDDNGVLSVSGYIRYSAKGASNYGTTYYFAFSKTFTVAGVSGFTIAVTSGKTTTTYTNGGGGYPLQSTAIYLANKASISSSQVATISVAVYQPIAISLFAPQSVTAVFSVPVWQSGSIVPKISKTSSTLKYSKRAGLYSIYTSSTQLPTEYQKARQRTSSVAVSANFALGITYSSDFNKLAGL
ncbi:heme peroxidase [Clavulina sp. PMI_390]|nr:heme peroxidase [Clavulina sp. PMI_390]